jgi:hypothetical protein
VSRKAVPAEKVHELRIILGALTEKIADFAIHGADRLPSAPPARNFSHGSLVRDILAPNGVAE